MQHTATMLPDGTKPLASAQARLISPPPWWTKGAGPLLALFILVGLVTGQRLITDIATVLMVLLIATLVLRFTAWRKHVTLALGADALYVLEGTHSQRFPLASLMNVIEAEAKIGPNTLHLEFAGQDRMSFMWSSSSDTQAIVAALRRARDAA